MSYNGFFSSHGGRFAFLRTSDAKAIFLLVAISLFTSFLSIVWKGVPIAAVHDEMANYLMAETFANGRLTNPSPEPRAFFETIHVLTSPSYQAKYPPAQALYMALGIKIGSPLFGIWLSSLLFVLAVYYGARGMTGVWHSFFAGVLVVCLFGFSFYWNHSYWGGNVSAIGGSLVLGGSVRLVRKYRPIHSCFIGLGVSHLFLSRPYEGVVVCLVIGLWLVLCLLTECGLRESLRRLMPAAVVFSLAIAFQSILNRATTGGMFTGAYMLYERQYFSSPMFWFQSLGDSKSYQQPILDLFYNDQIRPSVERFSFWPYAFVVRMLTFIKLFSYFFVLLIPVAFFGKKGRLPVLACLFGFIASLLPVYNYPHYFGPIAGVGIIAIVCGLEYLLQKVSHRLRPFIWCFMAGATAFMVVKLPQRWQWYRFDSSALVAFYSAIEDLEQRDERSVVLISVGHGAFTHLPLVYNDANWHDAKVLRAHDLGERDLELIAAFPDRVFWQMHISELGVKIRPIYRPGDVLPTFDGQ